MGSGHDVTPSGWDSLEAPLSRLDPLLESFARRHWMRLLRNEREYAGRSLRRGLLIDRLIQIYPDASATPRFNVWLCATQDRLGKRYWRQRFLGEGISADELEGFLRESLEAGYAELMGWRRGDLEYATDLG